MPADLAPKVAKFAIRADCNTTALGTLPEKMVILKCEPGSIPPVQEMAGLRLSAESHDVSSCSAAGTGGEIGTAT